MEDREFLQLFQQAASYLRARTTDSLLQQNSVYQEVSQMEEQAEKEYLQLSLNEEQRQIIDGLLQQKEHSCLIYADAAYLAGIKSAVQMYSLLNK